MKTLTKAMPLILTLLGGVGMWFLAIRLIIRLPSLPQQIIASVCFLIYCYWLNWESHISVNELNKSHIHKDYHTMELAALAKLTTLAAAFLGGTTINPYLAIPGIIIMVWGIRLRQYAVIALGRQYSHRLRIPEGTVCEDGPYNRIRHPAYMGTFAAHIGFVMVFFNFWSALSVSILWSSAVLLRTIIEDRMLMGLADYKTYSERVKYKLIKGIW